MKNFQWLNCVRIGDVKRRKTKLCNVSLIPNSVLTTNVSFPIVLVDLFRINFVSVMEEGSDVRLLVAREEQKEVLIDALVMAEEKDAFTQDVFGRDEDGQLCVFHMVVGSDAKQTGARKQLKRVTFVKHMADIELAKYQDARNIARNPGFAWLTFECCFVKLPKLLK